MQMTDKSHPSRRHLILTWIILILLTLASMISGQATDDQSDLQPLGYLPVAILLTVTFFKARQILRIFLNLRITTSGWRTLFGLLIGGLLAFIFASYAIGYSLSIA